MVNRSKTRNPRFWALWRESGAVATFTGWSSDGATPSSCNPDIFTKGEGVAILDGRPNAVEHWVRSVAKKAKAQLDWHYSGGRANVLHLGDDESRQRVLDVIAELEGELQGTILSVGQPALYRKGVPDEPGRSGAMVRRDVNGQLVLDDPDAVAVAQAVGKHNCRKILELNSDRVVHFKQRIVERGLTAADVVIVLVNVDDVHGGPLAETFMPGANWQEFRDRGEVPFARGLVRREGMQEALRVLDEQASTKLQTMDETAVVVVDHGVVEVFAA